MWVRYSLRRDGRVVRPLDYNTLQITFPVPHRLSRSKVSAAKTQRVRRLKVEGLLEVKIVALLDLGFAPAENKVGVENSVLVVQRVTNALTLGQLARMIVRLALVCTHERS